MQVGIPYSLTGSSKIHDRVVFLHPIGPTKPGLAQVKGEGEAVENDARAEGYADLICESLSALSGKTKTVGNAPRSEAASGIIGRSF